MLALYPELEPFECGTLEAGDHAVYFEQAGNKTGIPVLFLHGGPGSGCNENSRRYFDPAIYRIILFDQRASNRSQPNGCITDNTTQAILNDIEAIRRKFGIDQWCLFGGSWGATLALLYAEQYPQHVSGMILRGTFLARTCDFNWFANDGVSRIFPDYWQEFIAHFPVGERDDLLAALYSRIFSSDRKTQRDAALAWSLWAGRVVTYGIVDNYVVDETDEDKLINAVRIEMHYAHHRYFIAENQILDNIAQLPDVPVTLIHGRRDLTCLPESSWSVQRAIDDSKQTSAQLVIVANAGHLAGEAAMVDALISATNNLANIVR